MRVVVGLAIALPLTALLLQGVAHRDMICDWLDGPTGCGDGSPVEAQAGSPVEANGKLGFDSDRDRKLLESYSEGLEFNFEIYVMNADGSGQRRLTRNPADDSAPSWSPDGRTIAFESDRDGDDLGDFGPTLEIYVMNADGSGQRRLTRNPADYSAPSWSPDGRKG